MQLIHRLFYNQKRTNNSINREHKMLRPPLISKAIHKILDEKSELERQVLELQKSLVNLKWQYEALKEDFEHALKGNQFPKLAAKKIAYIGGNKKWQNEYKAIAQYYQSELVVPKCDSIESVCEAIQLADEVICPVNCANQELCQAAASSSTKYNKPLLNLDSDNPKSLVIGLSEIAVKASLEAKELPAKQ